VNTVETITVTAHKGCTAHIFSAAATIRQGTTHPMPSRIAIPAISALGATRLNSHVGQKGS